MTNITRDERINWIGGSEVAALLNVLPYMSRFQLWNIKSGILDADDLDDVERIQAGQFMEAAIAEWAKAKWPDLKMRNVHRYIQHPKVGGFGASLDRETVEGHHPVEIKNVDGLEFYKNDQWQSEGGEITDAPAHILVQVQAQLACSGKDKAWLLVCVGGNRLFRMLVKRHESLIIKLEKEVVEFWQSVKDGDEPKPDYKKDGDIIKALYPESSGEAIDLSTDNFATELADILVTARQRSNDWGKAADAAAAELFDKIRDASEAVLSDGRKIVAPVTKRKGYSVKDTSYRKLAIKAAPKENKK